MRVSGLRFLRSLACESIAKPRFALGCALCLTLIAAPGLWRLKLRTDGHALLPKSAPEVLYDNSIREQFGINDVIVTLVVSHDPNGIFNRASLELTRDLTTEFQRLPGVDPGSVISLATEPGFRFGPRPGVNRGLIGPALTDDGGLVQLREDLRGIEIYTGTLVSLDGSCAAILIGIPPAADRDQLFQKILRVIAQHRGGPNEIEVTGAPVAESLLGIQILEDLGVPRTWLDAGARSVAARVQKRLGLAPVAALVMMLTLLAFFRNVLAALVPLSGVAAALLFVFGWMGWVGTPIYLTMAVMPVLLTVLSVTNDIYLFNRYFALIRARPGADRGSLLEETFDSLVWPVACTALTATAGFFSFAFSPLAPVRAFGIFTGLGALFGLFFSLTAVPAMLAMIPPARLTSRHPPVSRLAGGFITLGDLVVRRRWFIAGAAMAVTLLAPFGVRRLVVQDSWISGFDPDSEFRKATQLVNDKFFGMHLLFVSFDVPQTLSGEVTAENLGPGLLVLPPNTFDPPILIKGSALTLTVTNPPAVWHTKIEVAGPVSDGRLFASLDRADAPRGFWEALSHAGRARYEIPVQNHVRPEVIRSIRDLESFIRDHTRYAVGGTLGPWDYLTTTRFMTRPLDPFARQLDDNPVAINLLWNYYSLAVGPKRLHQVVDTNYWRSLTTVFLKDANFVDTAKLMSDLRDYEREYLTPRGIKIAFAGDVAVSQSLIRGIVTTQLHSLAWSLLGIFAVTAWFGGSWRWGFYCLLPSLLAVIIKFAIMGWLGIPLGVATSMFAAMTLGLGVNCAIHLMEAERQLRIDGAPLADALPRALALSGPPACINTLALCLGFGILIFSKVPANARLGLLLSLGLAICFLVSMILLPIWLRWKPPSSVRGPNH